MTKEGDAPPRSGAAKHVYSGTEAFVDRKWTILDQDMMLVCQG
jgi:hypothetical protein